MGNEALWNLIVMTLLLFRCFLLNYAGVRIFYPDRTATSSSSMAGGSTSSAIVSFQTEQKFSKVSLQKDFFVTAGVILTNNNNHLQIVVTCPQVRTA